ncbi:PTS sugar transporter subunit IIA [Treponema primitia]|uniref:PTS sugar transporter subunit IIA n=1 Tax=Treponema primitia TaxID=88058 RepID=UPI00397F2F63
MKIDDILRQDCIIENLVADTKEEALTKMGEVLLAKGYVKESFIPAILERERNYPSGLPMEGHKIAIPHTDSEHVNQSTIFFARLAKPLEFSSMGDPNEKIQVQLISMFVLKEKKKIGYILEVLINTYQDNATLEAILQAKSVQDIYAILRKAVGANMTETEEE